MFTASRVSEKCNSSTRFQCTKDKMCVQLREPFGCLRHDNQIQSGSLRFFFRRELQEMFFIVLSTAVVSVASGHAVLPTARWHLPFLSTAAAQSRHVSSFVIRFLGWAFDFFGKLCWDPKNGGHCIPRFLSNDSLILGYLESCFLMNCNVMPTWSNMQTKSNDNRTGACQFSERFGKRKVSMAHMAHRRRHGRHGPALCATAILVCNLCHLCQIYGAPGGPGGPGRCFAGRRTAAVAALTAAAPAAVGAPALAELSPPLERATKRYGEQIQGHWAQHVNNVHVHVNVSISCPKSQVLVISRRDVWKWLLCAVSIISCNFMSFHFIMSCFRIPVQPVQPVQVPWIFCILISNHTCAVGLACFNWPSMP